MHGFQLSLSCQIGAHAAYQPQDMFHVKNTFLKGTRTSHACSHARSHARISQDNVGNTI